MNNRVTNPLIVLICIGCLAALFIRIVEDPRVASKEPRFKDGEQNLTLAYNLYKHGLFSDSLAAQPDTAPYNRREPLYPLLLSGALHLMPQAERLTAQCLVSATPTCLPQLIWLKGVNIAVLLAASITAFSATRLIMGGTIAPLVASLWTGLSPYLFIALNDFYSDLFASLLCLLLSTSLYLTVQRLPRAGPLNSPWGTLRTPSWNTVVPGRTLRLDCLAYAAAVLAGVSMGGLMLVKAVFVYLGILVALGFSWIACCHRTWQPIQRGIVVLLIAYCLAGSWAYRNYVALGSFQVAGRDGEILAIRAEYSRMPWQEYALSFCAFTPICKEEVLPRLAPEAAIHLHESDTGGYYRRTKDRIAALRSGKILGNQAQLDQQLSQDAIALIRQNWLKHLALTLTFAYRGMLPHFPYFIAFGIFLSVALRTQHPGLLLFLLPSLYSFGIHALASHYIDRYSVPLLPSMAVLLAPLSIEWFQRIKRCYLSNRSATE